MLRLLIVFFFIVPIAAQSETIRLAVTTSFHNSGLAEILLPEIQRDTGIEVQLLVVGTGQAIRLGQAGDVDAILVHSRAAEEAFIASGNGLYRREIMFNDFVILGPTDDPARLLDATNINDAMRALLLSGSRFVSRGDDSGTHKAELSLWAEIDTDPAEFESWYLSVGAGMGAALNAASGMNAYIFADRASWLNFANMGELTVLFQGDSKLFNQYAYLPVNAERHPNVSAATAIELEHWLTGERARDLINSYTISGSQLFTFNAE